MTTQQTNEYNERCARFLNLNRDKEVVIYNMKSYPYDLLKFHTDWNWIMEVVEAIENSNEDINVLFFPQGCAIERISVDANTKKQAVIEAINQFLIWNEKQTTL